MLSNKPWCTSELDLTPEPAVNRLILTCIIFCNATFIRVIFNNKILCTFLISSVNSFTIFIIFVNQTKFRDRKEQTCQIKVPSHQDQVIIFNIYDCGLSLAILSS